MQTHLVTEQTSQPQYDGYLGGWRVGESFVVGPVLCNTGCPAAALASTY